MPPPSTTTPQQNSARPAAGQVEIDTPALPSRSPYTTESDLRMLDFKIRLQGVDAVKAELAEMPPERKTALAEALKTRLGAAEPANADDRLKWLHDYAALRAIDASPAKGFEERAAQQVSALLPERERDSPNTDLSKLDQSLRIAKICLDYGPQSSEEHCLKVIGDLHQQLRTAEVAKLQAQVDQTMVKGEALYRSNLKEWQTELLQALNATPGKLNFGGAFWKQLASKLDVTSTAATYKDATGGVWSLEAFAPALGKGSVLSLRSNADRDCFLTLGSGDLLNLIETKNLDARLAQATEHLAQENDPALRRPLRDVEFAVGNTCCLTVVPRSHDRVTTTALFGMLALEPVLAARYGSHGSSQLILSDKPGSELRSAVAAMAKQPEPPQDVVLNIDEHGDRDGFRFAEPLTPAFFRTLATDYPQFRFHVVTNACNGANMREGILANPEPAPLNLAAYLQVKPDVINLGMFTDVPSLKPAEPHLHTPYQSLLLLKQLLEPAVKTFGEAFDNTDRESKKVVPADGEAVIEGKLFSGLRLPPHSRSVS